MASKIVLNQLPDQLLEDQLDLSVNEQSGPSQVGGRVGSSPTETCELPDYLLEEDSGSFREDGTSQLTKRSEQLEAQEESTAEKMHRDTSLKEFENEDAGNTIEPTVGPVSPVSIGLESSPSMDQNPAQAERALVDEIKNVQRVNAIEEFEQEDVDSSVEPVSNESLGLEALDPRSAQAEGALVSEMLFPAAGHVLSEGKSSVHKDRDLGRSPTKQSSPMKQGSPTKPPLDRRGLEHCPTPEKSPLSKPSEVKASQEWRRRALKENRESPGPKYRSKGQKAGLKIAPRDASDRSPLAAMDLAMSQQMVESQLNGDFYRLLGFSSPTEELRHAQHRLQEREHEVAQLNEAVAELQSVKVERDANKRELEAARKRENALKEECARGAHALRKQIEEVALQRRDQVVFEAALGDADDRAAVFEERAETAERIVQELVQQLDLSEKQSAELQRELEVLKSEAEAEEGDEQTADAFKDELEEAGQRAKNLEGEMLLLTQQLEGEKAAKGEVEQQLELAQEKLTKYAEEVQSLLDNSEELKESLEAYLTEKEASEVTRKQLEEARDHLTEECERVNAELAAALQEKKSAIQESLVLIEQLDLVTREKEDIFKLLDAEQTKRRAIDEEVVNMEAGLSEASACATKLAGELADFVEQKERAEAEGLALQDEQRDQKERADAEVLALMNDLHLERAKSARAEAEVTRLTSGVLLAKREIERLASKAEDMDIKIKELTAIFERTKTEAQTLESKLQLVSSQNEEAELKMQEALARCQELTLDCERKNADLAGVEEQLDAERKVGQEMGREHETGVIRLEKMLQAALSEQFALVLDATAISEKMVELEVDLEEQVKASKYAKTELLKSNETLAVERETLEHLSAKVHDLEGQLASQADAMKSEREKAQATERHWEEVKRSAATLHKAAHFAVAEQLYLSLTATAVEERVEGLQKELNDERIASLDLQTQCKEATATQVEWSERALNAKNGAEKLEEGVACLTAELREGVEMLWSSAGTVRAFQERARASEEGTKVLEKKVQMEESKMEESKEAQRVLTKQADAARERANETAEALDICVEHLQHVVAEEERKLVQAVAEVEDAREASKAFEQQIQLEVQKTAALGAEAETLKGSLSEKNEAIERLTAEVQRVQVHFEKATEESTKLEENHRKEVEEVQARAQKEKVEWEETTLVLEREIGRWTIEAELLEKERRAAEERLEAATKQYESEKQDNENLLANQRKGEADLRAALEAVQEDVLAAQAALVSACEGHVAEVDRLRAQLAVEQELTEQAGADWQRQLQQAQMETAQALGQNALALLDTQSAGGEELLGLRAALEEAQAKVKAARAQADEQRLACSYAVAEKLTWTDQLRSAMDLARKLDARHQELIMATDLEVRVGAAELATCQQQLKEAQKKAQALLEQLASCAAELAVSRGTLEVTKQDLHVTREQCEAAESKLKECQAELTSVTDALTSRTTEKESLEEELNKLQIDHSELVARVVEERRVTAQDLEARAQAATAVEEQADGLREAMGKLSQERLAAVKTNASLQASLNEARAQSEDAQAHVAALEKALMVARVVSLGLAHATVRSALLAETTKWSAREAAMHEKQRKEREAWEEAATRSEAEFAELREFSEVEAAVVTERATELEAAVRQLHEEKEQLQASLREATCHHQDALQQLTEARGDHTRAQLVFSSTLAAADMRRAGTGRAFKDALSSVETRHAAALAGLQCEVEQMSELQLSTAATALAREQQMEEVQRQLAETEGQLAALKGSLHETSDKERQLASELVACRDEITRLRDNLARESEETQGLSQLLEEKDTQILELQDQTAETAEIVEQLRRDGAETAAVVEEAQQEKATLEGQLATCQDELAGLRATVRETERLLDETVQKLEAVEQSAESLRARVSKVAAAKESVERKRGELERQLASQSATWAAREQELTESMRAVEQRAQRAEDEKVIVQQQVEDLQSMEETLKGALERKRKEGAMGEAKLGELRERVRQLEEETLGLQERLREAEGENKALKQVCDSVALEVASLTRERNAAIAAIDEKEAAGRAHEKKAAALLEDVMKLELDNDRLEDEVTRKSKELVARNREMMAVAAKMHKAHADDKKRLLDDCNKRLAAKSAELQSAQSALEAARAAKEDCERKVAILIDNLRKAEKEVERLGDECDGMNDLLVTVDEAFDYHTATLVQLKGMRALASRVKKELQQPATA